MSAPSDKSEKEAGHKSPFDFWQKIYEANEKAWSAALDKVTATPAFAEVSGKVLETVLSAQKAVRENMRTYLETINVPTREDISRLGELLVGVEEKIDQLDERLARIESLLQQRGADAASAAPAGQGGKQGAAGAQEG